MNNPAETILAADASKGIITSAGKQPGRGPEWINSQRAVVLLTNKNLVCGQWTIPLDQISEAKLTRIRSLFGGGQVLTVRTHHNENFQFGMQLNPAWTNQQALPLTLENGKVKSSPLNIALRIFLIGYLIYLAYEKYFSGPASH